MVLVVAAMPAVMLAWAGAAPAAPDDDGGDDIRAAKKADSGFTTEGSRRLSTSESS